MFDLWSAFVGCGASIGDQAVLVGVFVTEREVDTVSICECEMLPFYFLKRLIDHDLYLTTRMLIEMVCILIHPNRVSVHEKQIKTTTLQNLVHNLVLLKTRLKQNLNP